VILTVTLPGADNFWRKALMQPITPGNLWKPDSLVSVIDPINVDSDFIMRAD
jgi:hypothetical protein